MRIAVLAGLVFAAPALAQTVETRAVPEGIAALVRADGIGSGWPTSDGTIALIRGDGRAFVLDGLDLRPLDRDPRPRPARPDMLPDGEETAGNDVRAAWLVAPTTRYGHGILGDAIEAGGLAVMRGDGEVVRLALGPGAVFEDRRARLGDLDGDGRDEIVVVESSLTRGAALAVYGLADDRLVRRVATPPIGRAHRWLNPAVAADLDGDGRIEVAYVETPHIGGTLRLYEFGAAGLNPDGAVTGFSNHGIGSREQDMAAPLDWNADGVVDLALPDASRRSLRVMSFAGGIDTELARIEHDAPIATAVLAVGNAVVYGLADGTLVRAAP